MNLALSGLVIFLTLLPGLIFRRAYYTEEFSKEYFKQSFFEVVATTLLPSLFLYSFWIFFVGLFGYQVSLESFGKLLIGNQQAIESFENINRNAGKIFSFHITLYIFSIIIGVLFKQAIRYYKFDRRYKLFRYQNIWHYLFTGELFEFKKSSITLEENKVEEIESVYIDALVSSSEGTIIYDGILVDYELSNDGNLKYIFLAQVERRYLKNDPPEQEKDESDTVTDEYQKRYYPIPGHYLVIPGDKILNLNFTFIALKPGEKEGDYKPVFIS